MIIEQELKAVELSPVKKDFYQIWNELLDVAGKLSARWDPSSTNESDPGIVLLKVLTALGDKLNYNIDKNILEAFMPSASQEESMRKLCDMLGYSMKYYQSATTTALISYTGGESEINATIPLFTTLSDIDNEKTYTTIKAGTIYKTANKNTANQLYAEVDCIEGSHQICETNDGQTAIYYNLLDDNYRYYMPESMIAENGIFVYDYSEDQKYNSRWAQVDNLNTQPSGTKCYKFGFDSRLRVPYLQFPEDVGTLMTDGIEIHYIRTNGIDGNIAARTLEHINGTVESLPSNGDEGIDITADLSVTNLSAATNGKNAETLTQAYNSFKKTIGTFDTLVTCRDYINKIYNLFDDVTNLPLVSNIIVADVRDDINRAFTLCELSDYGIKYTNMKATKTIAQTVTGKDSGNVERIITIETQEPRISNFDLVLYPFKTLYGTNTKTEYKNSFSYTDENKYLIESELEQSKTLAHNFIYPEDGDITCIKNYLKLNAKITTTTKVNSAEEKSILGNIYTAISASFNARELDFGEEIPFDSILKVIEQADPRIKNVALDEPELYTAVQIVGRADEVIITGQYDDADKEKDRKIQANKLVLRNILAGRVAAFDYDTSFQRAFNEQPYGGTIAPIYPVSGASIDNRIVKLTSECDIPINDDTPTTLTANEVVSFRAPNFRTTFTYPAYVNYFLHLENARTFIPKDSEYLLKNNEWIAFNYTSSTKDDEGQSSETVVNYVAGGGIVIKPNIDLYDSTYNKQTNKKNPSKTSGYNFDSLYKTTIDKQPAGMFTFGPNEQVEIREKAQIEFNTPSYFYWTLNPTVTDEKGLDLGSRFSSSFGSYVLEENEYLYYTDAAQVSLAYYGPGTEIILSNVNTTLLKINENSADVSAEEITQLNLRSIPWVYINLGDSNDDASKITVQEYQYLNLTAGDKVQGPINTGLGAMTIIDSSSWQSITDATCCRYADGSTVKLADIIAGNSNWQIRSRLEFNMGPATNQTLYNTYDKIYALSYDTASTIVPTPTTITATLEPTALTIPAPSASTGLDSTTCLDSTMVAGRGSCPDAKISVSGDDFSGINAAAFRSDATLTSIYLPDTIWYIGDDAFSNTPQLKAVYIYRNTPPTIYDNPFDVAADYTIYVPEDYVNTYKQNYRWSRYKSKIQANSTTRPLALKSNYPIQKGADNIDVSVKDANGTTLNDFKISTCQIDDNMSYGALNNKSNYWTALNVADTPISAATPYVLHINLPTATTLAENYGLVAFKNNTKATLTIANASGASNLVRFNSSATTDVAAFITPTFTDTVTIPAGSFTELQIKGATEDPGCNLNLSLPSDPTITGSILFGQLDVVKGINPQLHYQAYTTYNDGNSTATLTAEQQMLWDIHQLGATVQNNFYYNTLLDNSTAIDIDRDKFLTDPKYLYDYNNINNKFVISEIDYDSMKEGITIARSSKL